MRLFRSGLSLLRLCGGGRGLQGRDRDIEVEEHPGEYGKSRSKATKGLNLTKWLPVTGCRLPIIDYRSSDKIKRRARHTREPSGPLLLYQVESWTAHSLRSGRRMRCFFFSGSLPTARLFYSRRNSRTPLVDCEVHRECSSRHRNSYRLSNLRAQ